MVEIIFGLFEYYKIKYKYFLENELNWLIELA